MASRSFLSAGVLGVADQAVLSLSNLAIGLLLANSMDHTAFGLYVVGFAILLIAYSVQTSIVTEPMMILHGALTVGDQSRYFASLFRLQAVVAVACALAAALASLGFLLIDSIEFFATLIAVAICIVPVHLQLFLRSILYCRSRPGLVLLSDLLLSVLRVALVLVAYDSSVLSPAVALLMGGVAALASSLVVLPFCSGITSRDAHTLSHAWQSQWKYGKWLLAVSGAYWCSAQAPTLVASGLMAPAAAGILRACHYLASPIHLAWTGFESAILPKASAILASKGLAALGRLTALVLVGGTLLALAYSGITYRLSDVVMDVVYSGRYSGHTQIVAILLVDGVIRTAARSLALGLKATGRVSILFSCYAISAVAGLGAITALTSDYGLVGAALAAPLSSLTLLVALAYHARFSAGRARPATSTS